MAAVEIYTLLRRRRHPQQRPERATVHHAEAPVGGRLEFERVDIVPPLRHDSLPEVSIFYTK
jgi:hypothetical protein